MEKLTDLPNLGPVLAGNLQKIGVDTPEQLRALGARQAFLRIRVQVDPGACLHQLQALEGAVEGIRKSCLPLEKKQELKEFYEGLAK